MKMACFTAAIELLLSSVAFGNVWDKVLVLGETDKENPVGYAVNEPIIMTFSSPNGEAAAASGEYTFVWKRSGDDGIRETGRVPFHAGDFCVITTKLDRAGFVRFEGTVRDAQDKIVMRETFAPGCAAWTKNKSVFVDCGAGVAIDELEQELPEPADFDAWWAKQKALLSKIAMVATRHQLPDVNGCHVYAISVTCMPPRPVTGFLYIPANALAKSCAARVAFQGYGVYRQGHPDWAAQQCVSNNEVFLEINAHGAELDQPSDYYRVLEDSIRSHRYQYAFSPEENDRPENSYFRGMAFRVMRALEFVKSLPEWNGQDLIVEGGSQGGLQTSWAAGLDPDVTLARPKVTWGCNFAMVSGAQKRLKGTWHIPYAPGLAYYDAIYHIRRTKGAVEVTCAGLGDYTCPPSGLAMYYNAIPTPKSIRWFQGAQHGYFPPQSTIYTISNGHQQTGVESRSATASSAVKSN